MKIGQFNGVRIAFQQMMLKQLEISRFGEKTKTKTTLDLNFRHKRVIHLSVKYVRENLQDPRLGEKFLCMIPKA